MYSVMWSEHCSYKSSKVWLRQFGQKVTPEMKKNLMVGMGENAGVVDIGEGWAVTFKIESHNHPQLHRAVPGRGDRRRRHRARHHLDGRAPGRRHGRPALRRDRPPRHRPRAAGRRERHQLLRQLPRPAEHRRRDLVRPDLPGEPARQRARGRRAAPRGPAPRQRPRRRQQGRAVRRPHRRRRHRRRQHPGLRHVRRRAARPSGPPCRSATRSPRRCSSSAASSCSRATWSRASRISARPASRARPASSPRNGDGGMADRARRRAAARPDAHGRGDPHVGEPGAHDGDRAARRSSRASSPSRAKWDVETSVLGEVTDTGRLIITWRGETIVDVDPRTVAVDGPVYERPLAYPTLDRRACRPTPHPCSARPTEGADAARRRCSRCSAAPNLADKSWITNQYDKYVLGNTALSYPDDGGMVRVDETLGPRLRGRHGCQRPLLLPRPVPGRAARARRGVPQRRRHGRDARSRSPTASTSAARRTPR